MASITVNLAPTISSGTATVYPQSNWPYGTAISGAPLGSSVTTGSVGTDGNVTFTGLTAGTLYVAYQASPDRYVRFRVPAAAASTGSPTPDVWLPTNQGFLAQSCGPELATGTYSIPAGQMRLGRIPIQTAKTITNLVTYIGAGSTLTGAIGLLYKLDGTLIARTASQNTAWTSTGLKTMALTPEAGQSLALPAADVVGGLLVITATGAPNCYGTVGGDGAFLNAGFSSPAFRGGYVTGQVAVPSPLSGVSSDNKFIWLGLS